MFVDPSISNYFSYEICQRVNSEISEYHRIEISKFPSTLNFLEFRSKFSSLGNLREMSTQGTLQPLQQRFRVSGDSIKNREDHETLLSARGSARVPSEFAFHENVELVSACISRPSDRHTTL